jgi:glutathione S-transferase
MKYKLYYWPEIQGRGEFIRLALEHAGAEHEDVWRTQSGKQPRGIKHAPFAPPYLVAGKLVIAQTPNILLILARLRLAPRTKPGAWAHQLQLTIADWLTEVHDTHHPIGSGLYYEEQEGQAALADFSRAPAQDLDYFEGVLAASQGGYLRPAPQLP